MPPPQAFVRSLGRRSRMTASAPVPSTHYNPHSQNEREANTAQSAPISADTSQGAHDSSPRARYNRLIGQYIHHAHSAHHATPNLSRGVLEDLEWILTISHIPMDPTEKLSGYLRDEITRMVSSDETVSHEADILKFPVLNEIF